MLQKHVEHAVGSLEEPMTDLQLTRKFLDQCSLVLGVQGGGKASTLAWKIAESKDGGAMLKFLFTICDIGFFDTCPTFTSGHLSGSTLLA